MIKALLGRKRKLMLPNGEEHQAIYALVNLSDIKASHNEITFSNTEGYPLTPGGYNINDRNYKDDTAAQENVRKIAEFLNPESLISLSSTPAGTPIINKEGIVVSGNNRVMSLKLAAAQYLQNYEAYKQQLAEDVIFFGFDKDKYEILLERAVNVIGINPNTPVNLQLTQPVLVRIDENLPDRLTTEILAAYNQDSKKGERPVDKAVKLSNILMENEKCRNAILNIVDGYDTFSDLYSADGRADRKRLIENFVTCGLIPQAQLPSYFDNGEFTETGKDYVESILAALILTPDAIKVSGIEGVKNLRRIIIGSLPLLITNASLKEGSLKDYISEAVIIQYKINQVGDFADYARAQELFDENAPQEKSLYINRLLNNGRNDFKNAIRRYNDGVKSNEGQSLFAEEKLTIPEIFEKTIVSQVSVTDKKLIEGKVGVVLNEKEKQIIKEEGRKDVDFVSTRKYFEKPFQEEGLPNIGEGAGADFINNESNAREEVINIADLIPTQRILEKESIRYKQGKENMRPIILKNMNNLFVMDGHHRIASELENGKTQIKAQVFDVTDLNLPTYEESMMSKRFKQPNILNLAQKQKNEFMSTNIEEITQSLPTTAQKNWFFNDNFFKQHPDKILGTAYEASGRFGKVTKYKGDINAIALIDAPLDFIGINHPLNNPLLSTGNDVNVSALLIQPDVQDFVQKVIEKSDRQIVARASRKKTVKVDEDALVTEIPQLQTFEDVWRTYNPEISRDELEVFIWHKSAIGKPLSRRWVNLLTPGTYTGSNLYDPVNYTVEKDVITGWVRNGLVFYYAGDFIPAPQYLSGNMYDKKMQFVRDKDEIIEQYGEDVYNAQETAFNAAWRTIYEKRLTIGQSDESLVILPISRLANNFKITRIIELPDDVPFKIKRVTAQSSKSFGRPDWAKDITLTDWDRSREEFSELSLTDAFVFWMLRFKPELKEPVTHYEIAKHYCYGDPIRIAAVNDTAAAIKAAEAKREKLKSSTQLEGERLFKIFLDTQLEANDKIRLETQWNADYNNYLPIDFNKIPVAFNMCRYYKGFFEELKPEKREAVAFVMNNGSGILSYDVGVGKTPSAIFTMSAFLDAGYSRRPLLVVPNQVYKQFISEIKNFAPHIPILEGYNFSEQYLENFRNVDGNIEKVPEGVITVITYEGMERIGFTENTSNELFGLLYDILNQGGDAEREKTEKQKASFEQKLETIIGRGMAGTLVNIEDFGFDFMCYDEAHKMKKVFTAVKGEVTEDEKGKQQRGKSPYVINSGSPSAIALKGFMLNYYIQTRNRSQNVMLLTATPFTNSPLEIFSMLTMVGYDQLKTTDLNNIKTFFDTYIKASTELVINTKLKPQFKQVILGFNNLISLQTLIRRFINYKTGEDVNVKRPAKYVLPYLNKIDNGILVHLADDEKIETYIQMTPRQEAMMDQIIAYVEGGQSSFDSLSESDAGDENEDAINDNESIELSEDLLSSEEKQGVRIIKGLTWSRNLALSPHLFVHSGLPKPTYKTYISESPKLQYVMGCIKAVKEYMESKGAPVCGQVIYMDRGIEYFPLLKEYLVKVVGYAEHEVGIIQSGLPKNGKRSKEYIKNLFNGEMYNEDTQLFEPVGDDQRIKIIIGSSTIKEGINLQRYGAVLYNCFIDWNPTDQQQLDGRIWRQGNVFNSVRIVMPLVVNSADIFLFQKLQEKTSRLNTIWATDGKKNVLNTEEFNPEELKYALIRDVNVIAELKSIEEKAQLESRILGYDRQKEIIAKIREYASAINGRFDAAKEIAETYRILKLTDNKLNDAQIIVRTINDVAKSQKDIEGRPMVSSYEKDRNQRRYESFNEWQNRVDKIKESNYSPIDELNKPYWFADFALAVRDLDRLQTTFLKQNDIPFSLNDLSSLDKYLFAIDENVKNADQQKEFYNSDEFKQQIIQAEIERREKEKIEYKSVPQNIVSFSRLNYLLNDKKAGKNVLDKYKTCPPMDAAGNRLTDADALAHMDACIAASGQTKDTWFNKETNSYQPAREALHQEIVDEMFTGVKCVGKEKPIAVFTGGSPASGKTTYLGKVGKYLLTPDVFKLDADEIRSKLPEYQGWNANSTHKETQDIVNNILEHIGDGTCRYDFIYDGTMNKASKYFSLIKKVKELGYETFIIFLDIPYGVARNRALNRYKKTGRYVPMEVIDDFFKVIPGHNGLTMGQYALNELKQYVDGYIVIDGITGQIIEKGGKEMPQSRVYSHQAAKEKHIQNQINYQSNFENAKKMVEVFDVPVNKPQKTAKLKKIKAENSSSQEILDTIAGLKILADLGDQEAIDTIEGLKLLI